LLLKKWFVASSSSLLHNLAFFGLFTSFSLFFSVLTATSWQVDVEVVKLISFTEQGER